MGILCSFFNQPLPPGYYYDAQELSDELNIPYDMVKLVGERLLAMNYISASANGSRKFIMYPRVLARIFVSEDKSFQPLRLLESIPIANPPAQNTNKIKASFQKIGLWIISPIIQIIIGALGTILGAYYIIRCQIPH